MQRFSLRFIPPEKSPARSSARSVNPIVSMTWSTLAARERPPRPRAAPEPARHKPLQPVITLEVEIPIPEEPEPVPEPIEEEEPEADGEIDTSLDDLLASFGEDDDEDDEDDEDDDIMDAELAALLEDL